MSTLPSDERNQLAAEYALGVLDGDDLQRARALLAGDPDFRAEVGGWSARLAPMLDEVAPVAAPANLWPKIESRLRGGDNVVVLRRKLGVWQGVAAAMTALAASLALVVVTRAPEVAPVAVQAPVPMVAMLGNDRQATMMVASWNPAARRLMVAATADIPADPVHAHELWVISADGRPRSLGTMPNAPKARMDVPEPMARQFADGAMLAVSVEPMGGSPTGQPTGPVIASGKLERA
jgi:anti-sigma-K factor RskA